ncbi:AGE family epimerase/isomerase [Salipiger sp. IMCC34102]|uniref:AGE family epimerase/isomerase n=1 Tax=Salipiger sp. IMCC34102 TaxID=2510647 RepID=UPI001F5CBBA7|nr:AGE family epimerase/isomerase [Salipiger sp. IMCC34102]
MDDPKHRAFLKHDARAHFEFFRASLCPGGRIAVLDAAGVPLKDTLQELHTAARLVHSYALGQLAGVAGADGIVDAGLRALFMTHRDTEYGGYLWAVRDGSVIDGTKLAYGHVFVLLAASSARIAGHEAAKALFDDVADVIETRFWDESAGLLRDEFNRDWTPFSTYRGMNANMHGVEAMLTAYEATGDTLWRDRAGRILEFLTGRIAPIHDWRLPEHYHEDWSVDDSYDGNPMFRPAGTTPGHSFELARLVLQHWDLCGRPSGSAVATARHLVDRALSDAWRPDGGFVYTLNHGGAVAIADRYWWPVTEAIGALATLLKIDHTLGDEEWYRRLWVFAEARFIDTERGGWFPEIDSEGERTETQFTGKPDIYHSLQADLIPLVPSVSKMWNKLGGSLSDTQGSRS